MMDRDKFTEDIGFFKGTKLWALYLLKSLSSIHVLSV